MSAVATNVYCALRSDDPYTWTTISQLNAYTKMHMHSPDNAGDTAELFLHNMQRGHHCLMSL